jgi:[ribosomal protein S5]-alanine N-acetyltransferase
MNTPVILETERLVLCRWEADDLERVHLLHSRPDTSRYLSADGHPWTFDEARVRLEAWQDDAVRHRFPKAKLIGRDTREFVGRAGFSIFGDTGEFELGFTIGPEFRGRGYATEIASALASAFLAEGERDHFIAYASVDNHASLRVLEKIGMTRTHTAEAENMHCHFYRMERCVSV